MADGAEPQQPSSIKGVPSGAILINNSESAKYGGQLDGTSQFPDLAAFQQVIKMNEKECWKCDGCGYKRLINPIGSGGKPCPNSLDCKSRTYTKVSE